MPPRRGLYYVLFKYISYTIRCGISMLGQVICDPGKGERDRLRREVLGVRGGCLKRAHYRMWHSVSAQLLLFAERTHRVYNYI